MTRNLEQRMRPRAAALALAACLALKPLLLLCHVLLEGHCPLPEVRAAPWSVLADAPAVGFCPQSAEHQHAHHLHPSGTEDSPSSRCPHPIEEHLATLKGDPLLTRSGAALCERPPLFAASAAPLPPAPRLLSQRAPAPLAGLALAGPPRDSLPARPRAPPCA
ncbi:MAG: hypothetical protein HY812_15850 [Planctomycetes bacterium]|nr:hypothetical protein [Planctomycetota bacterium]